jgi:hypothetical protein
MRSLWRNLLIGACLLSFVLLLGFFNITKPRILVLHSAAEGSPWADKVDVGMRETLADNRRPITVEWRYMAITAPADPRRVREAVAEANRAIDRMDPDLIIAVDDEANSLVARQFVGRESPRILYVSVNGPPADYGFPGARNVSGVSEQLPWQAVRDAVAALFPGRPARVAALGVQTASGNAELSSLRAFDWGPLDVAETALVSNTSEWKAFVTRSHADVLLVLDTQDLPDEDGVLVSAADLALWTQHNAKALPIGLHTDFVKHGGGFAIAPPPDDYGEQAIRLALDWLDDRTTPGPPAVVTSSHFEVAVRQHLLADRKLTLPTIYLEAARENGTLLE